MIPAEPDAGDVEWACGLCRRYGHGDDECPSNPGNWPAGPVENESDPRDCCDHCGGAKQHRPPCAPAVPVENESDVAGLARATQESMRAKLDRLHEDVANARAARDAWQAAAAKASAHAEERLRVVEGERDAAHEAGYWVGYGEGKDEAETRDLNYDAMTDRAESAEDAYRAMFRQFEAMRADRDRLRAGVEALADEWDEAADKWPYAVWHEQQKALVRDLRDLLADRSTR